MTTRTWNTQRPTSEGVLVRNAQSAVVIPDLSLSAFRASFTAVHELAAAVSNSFAVVAERIKAEYEKATEGLRAAYKAMPRAARRAQGKQHRITADRKSKAWPGTDALTPDHPARVVYKHLLSHCDMASALLDRALDRCSGADDRAHRHADTATAETPTVADEVTPVTQETPERIAHQPRAPQLLMAVTSSRNQPADSHTRTVITDRKKRRQAR